MNQRRHWLVPTALFAAVLALYLAFPTKDFYWDGAGFALVIDHPTWFPMILPNHPIYIGVGWLAHFLARMIIPTVGGLPVLQVLDSVFGAAAVVFFYKIAKALFKDELQAALLAGLFALSGTWWKFSTDADAYIPSVMALLITARLLLPDREPRPVLVAMAHAVAMLFHELAVMFVVPAAIAIYLQSRAPRRDPAGNPMKNVAVYLSTAFVLAAAGYYTSFRITTGHTAIAEYLRWITYHTPGTTFSMDAAHDAWMTIRGTLRLVAGGRVGAFHTSTLELGGLLVFAILGGFFVFRAGPVRERPSASRYVVLSLASWLAVYVAFLFFWLPENTFYRMFYLPPLVLLVGCGLERWGGRSLAYAMFVLLGGWNYLFFIHPHSLVESNIVLRAALAMNPLWKPGTWVYQGAFIPDNWTIFCFNPQVMFKDVERANLAHMATELKAFEEEGHETWIDQSGIDLLESDPAQRQWLAEHTRPGFKREFSDEKHKVGFDRLFP